MQYSDVCLIGNGSFGVVYRAKLYKPENGESVAIKKVLQDKRFKVPHHPSMPTFTLTGIQPPSHSAHRTKDTSSSMSSISSSSSAGGHTHRGKDQKNETKSHCKTQHGNAVKHCSTEKQDASFRNTRVRDHAHAAPQSKAKGHSSQAKKQQERASVTNGKSARDLSSSDSSSKSSSSKSSSSSASRSNGKPHSSEHHEGTKSHVSASAGGCQAQKTTGGSEAITKGKKVYESPPFNAVGQGD